MSIDLNTTIQIIMDTPILANVSAFILYECFDYALDTILYDEKNIIHRKLQDYNVNIIGHVEENENEEYSEYDEFDGEENEDGEYSEYDEFDGEENEDEEYSEYDEFEEEEENINEKLLRIEMNTMSERKMNHAREDGNIGHIINDEKMVEIGVDLISDDEQYTLNLQPLTIDDRVSNIDIYLTSITILTAILIIITLIYMKRVRNISNIVQSYTEVEKDYNLV